MAFSGPSRTLVGTESAKNAVTSAFEVSTEEWSRTMTDVDDFYSNVMMKNIPTMKCYKLDVGNSVPVTPMELVTKESKKLISKLTDKVRGCVYIQHSIIYLLYIPTILEVTTGYLTIKLFNPNTGESVDVDTDSPANEAAVLVARWPRSLHAGSKSLCLLVSASVPGVSQGAIVGTLFPYWEDALKRTKLYEKEYPSLRFPIAKTDALSAVKDIKFLQGLTTSRLTRGGTAVDISPTTIDIKALQGSKARTVEIKMLDESPSLRSEGSDAFKKARSDNETEWEGKTSDVKHKDSGTCV